MNALWILLIAGILVSSAFFMLNTASADTEVAVQQEVKTCTGGCTRIAGTCNSSCSGACTCGCSR